MKNETGLRTGSLDVEPYAAFEEVLPTEVTPTKKFAHIPLEIWTPTNDRQPTIMYRTNIVREPTVWREPTPTKIIIQPARQTPTTDGENVAKEIIYVLCDVVILVVKFSFEMAKFILLLLVEILKLFVSNQPTPTQNRTKGKTNNTGGNTVNIYNYGGNNQINVNQ